MRTLGFRTHVLLVLAGAAGLVYSLGMAWYAAAPPKAPDRAADIGNLDGPLNGLVAGVQRWLTAANGETGWHALQHWGLAMAAMAGVAALGALACVVPVLQPLGRDLLRYAALAAFGLAAWKLLDPPGANDALELRRGALAGGLSAAVMVTCAMGVANAPLRRKLPVRTYTAPPPPPAYGSTGPPGA
jgi:hypothetical protein